MKIREIVKDKGFELIAIDAETTVADAVHKMVERNIGAVMILKEGKPVGLYTERDALKCWVDKKCFDDVPVGQVMTKDLFIAEMDDEVTYAMAIMIQKKVRHLPVVEKGNIITVLSIRDIVKASISKLEAEVHYLKDYITGG